MLDRCCLSCVRIAGAAGLAATQPLAPAEPVMPAMKCCVGCGCTSERACRLDDGPCWWVRLPGDPRGAVCSGCATTAELAEVGDRVMTRMVAGLVGDYLDA
jgi:hypothetical protein